MASMFAAAVNELRDEICGEGMAACQGAGADGAKKK